MAALTGLIVLRWFKNWHGRQFLNRIRAATTRDGVVQNHYRVFAPQKLEVHELTRTSIHEPNTDVAHYQGRQSIYNIDILISLIDLRHLLSPSRGREPFAWIQTFANSE